MERRHLLTAALAAGVVADATPSLAASDQSQDIVGSWFGTVTATNPPLAPFNDLISFHTGGVVTESRRYLVPSTPFGNLLETTGHGAWGQTGKATFAAFFRFLLQDANSGAPIGTDNIDLALTLDPTAGTLTGTFQSQIENTTGNVLATFTGNYSATLITL
jgi:hypothetical protein